MHDEVCVILHAHAAYYAYFHFFLFSFVVYSFATSSRISDSKIFAFVMPDDFSLTKSCFVIIRSKFSYLVFSSLLRISAHHKHVYWSYLLWKTRYYTNILKYHSIIQLYSHKCSFNMLTQSWNVYIASQRCNGSRRSRYDRSWFDNCSQTMLWHLAYLFPHRVDHLNCAPLTKRIGHVPRRRCRVEAFILMSLLRSRWLVFSMWTFIFETKQLFSLGLVRSSISSYSYSTISERRSSKSIA